jgi:tRNA(Ile)-lysidine synthase
MISETFIEKFLSNIEQLQPFEDRPKIAVALSGGIDSMALLLLTKQWLTKISGQLIAITVDHNLRPEASLEAIFVGKICKKLNIEHTILQWQHSEISSNIQAKARKARYNLLTKYCQEHDILHLFVGHQMQDSVENFFIKLSRGSGIFGLIANNCNFIHNVRVCKPILNFTKNECLQLLKASKVEHVEDPSNLKKIYLRNNIRFNLQNFAQSSATSFELFQQRVVNSQKHLATSAELVQENVIDALCSAVSIYNSGFAIVSLEILQKYCFDTQTYLLIYLLTVMGGNDQPPRAQQVTSLLNLLQSNSFKGTTLSKCVVNLSKNDLIIYKELCNIMNYNITLKDSCFWDKRFRICVNNIDEQLQVNNLDLKSYHDIKKKIDLNQICDARAHRYKILFTLPVIKVLEKIVAVPNINYYEEFSNHDFVCVFEPLYVSKIIHL